MIHTVKAAERSSRIRTDDFEVNLTNPGGCSI